MKWSKWILILLVVLLCGSLLISADDGKNKDGKKKDKACRHSFEIDLSALDNLEIHLEGLEERIETHVAAALEGIDFHMDLDHILDGIEPALDIDLSGLMDVGHHAAHITNIECMKALKEVDRVLAQIDWNDFFVDFDWNWDDDDWDDEDWDDNH